MRIPGKISDHAKAEQIHDAILMKLNGLGRSATTTRARRTRTLPGASLVVEQAQGPDGLSRGLEVSQDIKL